MSGEINYILPYHVLLRENLVQSLLHAPSCQSLVQFWFPDVRSPPPRLEYHLCFVFRLTHSSCFPTEETRSGSGCPQDSVAGPLRCSPSQHPNTSVNHEEMVQGVNPCFIPSVIPNLKELSLFLRHHYFLPEKFLKSSVSECHCDKQTLRVPSLTSGVSAAAMDCEATREQKFHFTKNGVGLRMFGLNFISLNNRLE